MAWATVSRKREVEAAEPAGGTAGQDRGAAMSTEAQRESMPAASGLARARYRLRARQFWRGFVSRFSSSLTRRILVLNLGGLLVLVVGFLYLNQFRADIIDARVQSLQTQGEMIAIAIASSAAGETDAITIDPEKLLQLAPGESSAPADADDQSIEFSINPERIGLLLRRLVTQTRTRARVYDRDGFLLLDSRSLSTHDTIAHSDLPGASSEETAIFERAWNAVKKRFVPIEPRRNDDAHLGDGKTPPEVASALLGRTQSVVRLNSNGETIVSVGVPIQRLRAVRGALLLSTQGGDIDAIIASERWAILRIFLVLASVMFVLSVLLAGTIAEPVRKLAEAAERVRRGIKSRQQIPDFTNRSDEIGHLSGALRDMTLALYNRIDAIESFAADVSHELKNPLTSLRSAVEILPRVREGASKDRLLDVIQHDVRRLDRLISDISDASRLDAELARADSASVDLVALLRAVVALAEDGPRWREVAVRLKIEETKAGAQRFRVMAHDSRLAQVMTNLIDNARSFSAPGGEVRVSMRRTRSEKEGERIEIAVEDDGPGIPPHALERIFERFYTDRPEHGFGQNSGLGLSISRQIIEAHGGWIWAENRPLSAAAQATDGDSESPTRHSAGARFILSLPAAL
jgi:two-component system, OmpR family, sensor histidine kinase ChvG